MNVLLINPPYSLVEYNVYSKTGAVLPPLGLLYIAAYVRERCRNIDVCILDSSAYKLDFEGFQKELKDFQPDIVGITVCTATFSGVLKTAEIVKENFPHCIIVVGGPHVSVQPEECISSSANIDIAVIGEGEVIFAELLESIYRKVGINGVPNIVYKEGGKIVRTQGQHKTIDLDTLPFPARDLINMRLYHPAHGTYRRLPAANMITSRGCPFRCTFCSSSIFGLQYRVQSPFKTMQEIETLVNDYGIREVLFNDDVFTLDKKKTAELCELLLQKKLDFTWSCSTRVNLIDPPLLNKMQKSGCFAVGYGIESGDENILEKIDKDSSLKDAKKAIQWTKEAGMETRAFYILGFPGETKQTIKRTIEFSLELDTDFVIYNIISPMPGTKLFEEAKSNGLLLYEGREIYDKANGATPMIKLCDVTPSELKQFYNLAYRRYYIRPRYIFNQLRRIRSLSDFNRYIRGALSFLNWNENISYE
ncbi:MAG: radical SAM protein [Candidatus Omnitrophota bacterium]|nr:radical SAM protein [Candidatus Omnitrophota bacterium]